MAKEPTQIYAIHAYSKSINTTKRIFDEDSLLAPYQHTTRATLAQQKADAFAAQLNNQRHKGASDWVGKPQLQDYKPNGITRAAQIRTPTQRQRVYTK
jgi:hypothetical protein